MAKARFHQCGQGIDLFPAVDWLSAYVDRRKLVGGFHLVCSPLRIWLSHFGSDPIGTSITIPDGRATLMTSRPTAVGTSGINIEFTGAPLRPCESRRF